MKRARTIAGTVCVASGALLLLSLPIYRLIAQEKASAAIRQGFTYPNSATAVAATPPVSRNGTVESQKTPTAPLPPMNLLSTVATESLGTGAENSLYGILDIKKIDLHVPVFDGTSGKQLDFAVGHVTQSAIPGEDGTCVLAAHNAMWFRHLDELQTGDQIRVTRGGQTYVYAVRNHAVQKEDIALPNTAYPSLVLEACYPLDALYFTENRYFVYADLVSVQSANTASTVVTDSNPTYIASIPAYLAKEGVTLSTTPIPMGTLSIYGTPTSKYTESQAPLSAAFAATQMVIAYLKALSEGNPSGLYTMLPHGSESKTTFEQEQLHIGLFNTPLSKWTFVSPLNFTLQVQGTTLASGDTKAMISYAGKSHSFDLQFEAATNGVIHIKHVVWS